MNQIILIDKLKGWTSFDVVARIRGEIRKELSKKCVSSPANSQKPKANDSRKKIRVGHTGTLDPFATGLLIILIGQATKKQDQFIKLDKEYLASLRLGATSTTGDPEGDIVETARSENKTPSIDDISIVIDNFVGEISQVPPAFSAVKVNGERAYKLARAGLKVNLKERLIKIYRLKIVAYQYPVLKLKVSCSSGTYIRTLAEDIGRALGTGAYLTELRRTKIGEYNIKNAITIEAATARLKPTT